MGGAFDPPHRAHVALAEAALEQLALRELRIIPTGRAWHKSRPLTAATHRLAMVRMAFAHLPRTVVDDRETLRSGPSYTVDTLDELRAELPGEVFCLILGQDQAQSLPSWKAWERLPTLATICVARRPYSMSGSSDLQLHHLLQWTHLRMPAMELSATEVRAKLAARGDISALVPPDVARYIADHHLYRAF